MKNKLLLAIILNSILALSFFPPTPVSAAEPASQTWVLSETKVNPQKHPLTYEQDEPRFGGYYMKQEYTITETTSSWHQYSLKHAYKTSPDRIKEFTFSWEFDKPPAELVPGTPFALTLKGDLDVKSNEQGGSISHSAFYVHGEAILLQSKEGQGRISQRDLSSPTDMINIIGPGGKMEELTLHSDEPTGLVTSNFVLDETWAKNHPSDTITFIVIANGLEVYWVYEPGESKAVAPGETAKAEPAASTEPVASDEEPKNGLLIGWVAAYSGDVYIERGGKRIKVDKKGTPVMLGDRVATLDMGLARIQLDDKDPNRPGVGPSMINLGSNNDFQMETFRRSLDVPYEGFFGLIKGKIRTVLKGWSRNTSFKVKAGVSICGIRGSDVFISYDPDTERLEAYVIEGHMDVTNSETGEMKSLTDNQKLVVENGNIGEIQTLSQQEWDSLVKENGVEDMQPMSQAELDALLAEKNGASSGSPITPVIIGVGAVMVVGLAFFGLRKRLKKA